MKKPQLDAHAADLAFMQWVRTATKKDLGVELKKEDGWRKVAISRELQRRIKA